MQITDLEPWLFQIPGIVSFITNAIQTAEKTDMSNSDKEAKVLADLDVFLTTLPLTDEQKSTKDLLISAAKHIIAAQVTLMNILGFFKKSTPVVTPPSPPQVDPKVAIQANLVTWKAHLADLNKQPDSPQRATKIANTTARITEAEAELAKL